MYTDTLHSTKAGTLSGTLLALLFQNWGGLLNAALVAAVGAISSFIVSLLLNRIKRKLFKPKPPAGNPDTPGRFSQ